MKTTSKKESLVGMKRVDELLEERKTEYGREVWGQKAKACTCSMLRTLLHLVGGSPPSQPGEVFKTNHYFTSSKSIS
jgi:hypothetical protein